MLPKTKYITSLIVQRFILPIILCICCLLRPVGLSLPYLLLLFYLPFVPVATYRSIRGHTGFYLSLFIFVSTLLCLVQSGFQIFLAVVGNDFIEKCEFLEILLRHIGVVRLDDLDPISITQWLAPEVISIISSIAIFIMLKIMWSMNDKSNETNESETAIEPDLDENLISSVKMMKLGKVLSIMLLFFAGMLQPSVLNVIYYIIFLGALTWKSCNKRLERTFGYVLRIAVVFLMLQIVAFFIYQNPWPQKKLKPDSMISRLLGLTAIYSSSCDNGKDIRVMDLNSDLNYNQLINPIVLIICYFVNALTSNSIISSQNYERNIVESLPQELEGKNKDEIEVEEKDISKMKLVLIATKKIGDFIYKSSYAFTNISMLIWSIMYHSWFAFVLLIWANLIWIIPNQRRNILWSSPFLVAYAELLLLLTYIFSLNLKADEFKFLSKFDNDNEYFIGPILIKTFFTRIFLISLRQVIEEKQVQETANEPEEVKKKKSSFVSKASSLINAFFTKCWIFIVIITILIYSLSGQKMNIFRIVYMALLLIFGVTFQFSYSIWRKFLYHFWIVIICYSMIVLTLVYLFQFGLDFLKAYKDILGLKVYDTKELILHLLLPTLIVVFTNIHLNFCHEKFLEWSDIHKAQPGNLNEIEDEEQDTKSKRKKLMIMKRYFMVLLTLIEIHFNKIIMISIFSLAVINVNVLHFPFVILGVVGLRAKHELKLIMTRIGSLFTSILLISLMIYQLDIFDHNKFNTNCKEKLLNNAEWLGFSKNYGFAAFLSYIVIASIYTFIILYQTIRRVKNNKPPRTPTVVFKNIRRADADRDIPHLIKYLMNYGFFKFGIEICLIGYLLVIGSRMDIVACFYALWLFFLYKLERDTARKVWSYATYFIIASIPIQYLSLIGLPPGLCIEYPWTKDWLQYFNVFAFLPDSTFASKEKSKLLMLDFILLLIMCRQIKVFKIEEINENHPGGSNKSILEDIAQLDKGPFENPTHDFVDKIRNYFDVLMRFLFNFFFWITLAIVFLTGTGVNLLSFGYIIGSFIFLWQGTDFYLRPIYVIMRWWNYMITYNLFVILIKTLIQIVGCLNVSNKCTINELFGISCMCSSKYRENDPCNVESGLLWDGICFAFLILQKRMFSSYYFCHVINEAKASLAFSTRGSEIIEEINKKEMAEEVEKEAEILEKINLNLNRIKKEQQSSKKKGIKSHKNAIYSGDYKTLKNVEDKIDLDSSHNIKKSFLDDEEKSSTFIRLSRKNNFSQHLELWRENQNSKNQDGTSNDINATSNEEPSTSTTAITRTTEDINDKTEKIFDKVKTKLNLIFGFVPSILVSLTIALYHMSRKYRHIVRIFKKEKKILKRSPSFGIRNGSTNSIWTPDQNAINIDETLDIKSDDTILKIENDEDDFSTRDHNILAELFLAIWYLIISHTKVACFFIVFLNQAYSGSVMSLLLPLMVLFWGSITYPRPSKSFWIILAIYAQIMVVIKFIFQFDAWNWNKKEIFGDNESFSIITILGIQKRDGYASYDLLLLLIVLCHREILKSLSLWETKNEITVDNDAELVQNTNEDAFEESVLVNEETKETQKGFKAAIDKIKKRFSNQRPKKYADVYGVIFFCDFMIFFIFLFGFSAFSIHDEGGVFTYIQQNKVPVIFLLMLVSQFFCIVIDRALYLRKHTFGKIIFQLFLIIGLHLWMFYLLPAYTGKTFYSNFIRILFYMIKCMYLLLSAYQIRCGYPSRVMGNFLTKDYKKSNSIGFKIFMSIPFAMELRTLIDFVWTETSMSLIEWIKMEDIFANIFQVKCSQESDKTKEEIPRGQPENNINKYIDGGSKILIIIFVIWFPLTLFAFSSSIAYANRPIEVSVSFGIGPYESIYMMSAQRSDIIEFNEEDWQNLHNLYAGDRRAERSVVAFLRNYEPQDVVAVKFGSNSSSIWNISPPDRRRLLKDLQEDKLMAYRFSTNVLRNSFLANDQNVEYFRGNDEIGTQLQEMLINGENLNVTMPFIFPKFVEITNDGGIDPIYQLLKLASPRNRNIYRNLTLKVHEEVIVDSFSHVWWEVTESCDEFYNKDNPLYSDCKQHLTMYMFCEKRFPSLLSSYAATGIIGLYVTVIYIYAQSLRNSQFSGTSVKIMFEDLPYVDRVLQLCLDIYLVRESNEFTLEEDLFAKLIFLYRSPETMIEWTEDPEEEQN